jgi:hypothetical protein
LGTGLQYNPANNAIEQRYLQGGCATLSYMVKNNNQTFIPFYRYQTYQGGKKHKLDARWYNINESQIGV